MEESAIKALQDCEDEFDPFVGGIVLSSKAENVLSSGGYFLSTINSCCIPGNENEKEKLTPVDAFYEALRTSAREEKASNTVTISIMSRFIIQLKPQFTTLKYV